MKLAKLLIDKAAELCGSQAEVARRLGVDRAEITRWKSGLRPLSPEDAAFLADLANVDAKDAAAQALIERNEGTEKGDRLREILGKGGAVFAAAMLVTSYSAEVKEVSSSQVGSSTEKHTFRTSYFRVAHVVSLRVLVFRARCLRAWTQLARTWTRREHANPRSGLGAAWAVS